MAIDSTLVPMGSSDPADLPGSEIFPVELVLTIEFRGDSAVVRENWIWQTYKTRPGLRGIFITGHHYVRTSDG